MKTDTIAAIATAMTTSGIGIVRISGSDAFSILKKVFRPKNEKKNMEEAAGYTIHYGSIYEGDNFLDEVLVMVMRGPHSYTAEDTVEINCHGGVFVMKRILETVIRAGARPAEPGEFTKRAFLNGRIDLSQAEAVMDVIDARSDMALKSSLKQLKGSVKEKIMDIRSQIIYHTAFIETALDDPEHISLEGYSEQLEEVVGKLKKEAEKLAASFDNGRMLREGVKTVIVGKPNAGKSSLLNVLAGQERAIVTDIAGTTRDVLEEQISLGGVSLQLLDTAGIRSTEDTVEKIGVLRAKEHAGDADLILYVVDSSTPLDESDEEIMELLQDKKAVILLNKSDLASVVTEEMVKERLPKPVISISAKKEHGIQELEELVKEMFFAGDLSFNEEVMITNIRQKTALLEAIESFSQVLNSIEMGMPEDFFSIDLLNAYESLGSIIGESMGEDLVNEIFGKFCMGK